jgi:hypothetical protein
MVRDGTIMLCQHVKLWQIGDNNKGKTSNDNYKIKVGTNIGRKWGLRTH